MSDFVIETKKLTKIYGEQTAVSSVDIHVKPGRIYGLLGRNGAGKTTIMKMISEPDPRHLPFRLLGLSSKLPSFTRT